MALSQYALTTLQTIKDELGITDTSLDGFLERKINSMSEAIEKYCGRYFAKRTVTVKLPAPSGLDLILPDYPITTVSEVKLDGTAITDYEVYGDTGQLWRETGWSTEYYRRGIAQDLVLSTEKIIEVTYTTGYVTETQATANNPRTLPYELENYCIDAVKVEYYKKDVDPNIEQESLLSSSVKYDRKVSGQLGLPPTVINGLQQNGWVKHS